MKYVTATELADMLRSRLGNHRGRPRADGTNNHKGFSQVQISEQTGVSQQAISFFVNGHTRAPPAAIIEWLGFDSTPYYRSKQ